MTDPHKSAPLPGAPANYAGAEQYALTDDGVLRVYSSGPVTVLGFGGSDVPSEFNAAHYRTAVSDLLRSQHSSVAAFDLTGVSLVPSGMLGLLVSLTRLSENPPKVQVFNACPAVREVLALTRLDTIVEVLEVRISE